MSFETREDSQQMDYRNYPAKAEPPRGCSCHPDDFPPQPCPQKHALHDCQVAAATKHVNELFDDGPELLSEVNRRSTIPGCRNVTWADLAWLARRYG